MSNKAVKTRGLYFLQTKDSYLESNPLTLLNHRKKGNYSYAGGENDGGRTGGRNVGGERNGGERNGGERDGGEHLHRFKIISCSDVEDYWIALKIKDLLLVFLISNTNYIHDTLHICHCINPVQVRYNFCTQQRECFCFDHAVR